VHEDDRKNAIAFSGVETAGGPAGCFARTCFMVKNSTNADVMWFLLKKTI
jgi:hypothetical protein